jgi:Chromatin assembly factor 1 subunit A/F/Y rich C-terminus/F/Y-rich N-terminus
MSISTFFASAALRKDKEEIDVGDGNDCAMIDDLESAVKDNAVALAGAEQEEEKEKEKEKVQATRKRRRSSSSTKKRKVDVILDVARDADGKVIMPLLFGNVWILSLGTIDYKDASFHTKQYIFPVGYKCKRQMPSLSDANKLVDVFAEVTRGASGKVEFVVWPEDMPNVKWRSKSASSAWQRALEQIRRKAKVSVSGPEMFAFSNATVRTLIQDMENAHLCRRYARFVPTTADDLQEGNNTEAIDGDKTEVIDDGGDDDDDEPSSSSSASSTSVDGTPKRQRTNALSSVPKPLTPFQLERARKKAEKEAEKARRQLEREQAKRERDAKKKAEAEEKARKRVEREAEWARKRAEKEAAKAQKAVERETARLAREKEAEAATRVKQRQAGFLMNFLAATAEPMVPVQPIRYCGPFIAFNAAASGCVMATLPSLDAIGLDAQFEAELSAGNGNSSGGFKLLVELVDASARRRRRDAERDDTKDCCVIIESDDGDTLMLGKPKLFKFHDNFRPAYWGTFSRRSTAVRGRRPLARDTDVDYDYDSDAEWADAESEDSDAEDLLDSDSESDSELGSKQRLGAEFDDTSDEEDGDFTVPDGHLSDDERDQDDSDDNDEERKSEHPSVLARKATSEKRHRQSLLSSSSSPSEVKQQQKKRRRDRRKRSTPIDRGPQLIGPTFYFGEPFDHPFHAYPSIAPPIKGKQDVQVDKGKELALVKEQEVVAMIDDREDVDKEP